MPEDWTPEQIQVARNLCAICWRRRMDAGSRGIPPLLMLSVCLQEEGLNPNAVGDAGQSFGIFQLYQPVHPGTAGAAVDPWRDYDYVEVRARWELTYGQLGGDAAWADIANRPAFVEQFAPAAQGSIAWPAGYGALRYAEAIDVLEVCS